MAFVRSKMIYNCGPYYYLVDYYRDEHGKRIQRQKYLGMDKDKADGYLSEYNSGVKWEEIAKDVEPIKKKKDPPVVPNTPPIKQDERVVAEAVYQPQIIRKPELIGATKVREDGRIMDYGETYDGIDIWVEEWGKNTKDMPETRKDKEYEYCGGDELIAIDYGVNPNRIDYNHIAQVKESMAGLNENQKKSITEVNICYDYPKSQFGRGTTSATYNNQKKVISIYGGEILNRHSERYSHVGTFKHEASHDTFNRLRARMKEPGTKYLAMNDAMTHEEKMEELRKSDPEGYEVVKAWYDWTDACKKEGGVSEYSHSWEKKTNDYGLVPFLNENYAEASVAFTSYPRHGSRRRKHSRNKYEQISVLGGKTYTNLETEPINQEHFINEFPQTYKAWSQINRLDEEGKL